MPKTSTPTQPAVVCDEYVPTGQHHCKCHGSHGPKECTHNNKLFHNGNFEPTIGLLGWAVIGLVLLAALAEVAIHFLAGWKLVELFK